MAFLARRYRWEYRMVEIPVVVEAVVFPILFAVGTVSGRYRKYAGAPVPLSASFPPPGSPDP